MGILVEFFHDVLCAWCYCLSPRMRFIAETFPAVEVVHRSFALAPRPNSIEEIFGSRAEGKREIMKHWRAANLNDDEHRINAELMESREFDYPYSMPGLKACKAAELQGGQRAHWDMFDRIQRAHLTECLNIASVEVIERCARDVGLDLDRFRVDFNGQEVERLVEADMRLAEELGIYAVPTLVVDRRYVVQGAVHREELEMMFEQLVETGELFAALPSVTVRRLPVSR